MSQYIAEFMLVIIILGITGFILFIFFSPTTRSAVVTYFVGIHDMFYNSSLGT